MFHIAITGNHICTAEGIKKAVVLIRDGIITGIEDSFPEKTNYEVVNIGDSVLMPGFMAPHGAMSAATAAIAGGVTTMLMPLQEAATPVHLNCAFWGDIGSATDGIRGIKITSTIEEEKLRTCLPMLVAQKLPLLVHAGHEQLPSVLALCAEYHCRMHIYHLSSPAIIPQLQQLKQQGLPLTADTMPAVSDEQILEALQTGVIDFVASEAVPDRLTSTLPILWTCARQRHIHWSQLIQWLSEKPAKLVGFNKRKGKIAKGYDADLVAWNPHEASQQAGDTRYGVVERVWVCGEQVFDFGRFIDNNKGKIIGHQID